MWLGAVSLRPTNIAHTAKEKIVLDRCLLMTIGLIYTTKYCFIKHLTKIQNK